MILALTVLKVGVPISIFGSIFVGALKAVAPLLVFFLVMAAISQFSKGKKTNMKSIVVLYLLGTFLAGVVAVIGNFLFPVKVMLTAGVESITPPSGIGEVVNTLLMNVVENPVSALAGANYIGILFWAVVLGFALKNANETTKTVIMNISEAMTQVVKWIISFAPFGIMGLVYERISRKYTSKYGFVQRTWVK